MGWEDDVISEPAPTKKKKAAWEDDVIGGGGSGADEPASTGAGAFRRSAVQGVAPAAGGFYGMIQGARLGLAAGSIAPHPLVKGGLALAGGLGGMFLGAEGVRELQDKAIGLLPESWQEGLGLDQRQHQADIQQHPYISMAGDLAPNALFMGPGLGIARPVVREGASALERLFAHPVAAPTMGAAFGGGMEAGQEYHDTGTVDPIKLAIATGAGALMSHETRLGQRISGNKYAAPAEHVPPDPETNDPQAAPPPESPAVKAIREANGITDPNDPRVETIVAALERKQAELNARGALQSAEGTGTAAFLREQERLAAEREAIQGGTMDPGAASTAGRIQAQPVPDVIQVTPQGQGITGDLGTQVGADKYGARGGLPTLFNPPEGAGLSDWELRRLQEEHAGVQRGNVNTAPDIGTVEVRRERAPGEILLPSPEVQAQYPQRPAGLSEWDIRRAQEELAAGGKPQAPGQEFVVPEGRGAQSVDQALQQRQAELAFNTADRQRARVAPEVRDTQVGGRPEGVAPVEVKLNQGFPVKELGRRMVEVPNADPIEVVKVQRIDPRTGAAVEGSTPYEILPNELQTASYAKEPRMAADFLERSKGPTVDKGLAEGQMYTPEAPRPADHAGRTTAGVAREAQQSYRVGEHAAEGKPPIPEQQPGPHPGPSKPSREQAAESGFGKRQEGQAKSGDYRQGDDNTSTVARPYKDGVGFEVDDRGYVKSDKGGPIKFADNKQAAMWLKNVGSKSRQIFERVNHPGSGGGISIKEVGRSAGNDVVVAGKGDGAPGPGGGAKARVEGSEVPPGTPSPAPEPQGEHPRMNEARAHVAENAERMPRRMDSRMPLMAQIRKLGGIKTRNARGELTREGAEIEAALGDHPRGGGLINNKTGQTPDYIREALAQPGVDWFPDGGHDLQSLYTALEEEARGNPQHQGGVEPVDQADLRAEHDYREGLQRQLDDAGVQPHDPPELAAQKLVDYWDEQARQEAEDAAAIKEDFDNGPASDEIDPDGWQTEPDQGTGQGGEDTLPGWEDAPGQAAPDEGAAGNAQEQSGRAATGGREAGTERASEGQPRAVDRQAESVDRRGDGGDRGSADATERGRQSGDGSENSQAERGSQTRIEGTDAATREELKARANERKAEEKQQNPRAFKDKAQKGHDESGLFADQSEKAQEDMFAASGDKKAEAKKKAGGVRETKNKFYSNPIGDPDLWRDLRNTVADTFHWLKPEAAAWSNNIKHSWRLVQKDLEAGRIGGLLDLGKKHFYTNDGEMRSIGAKHNSQVFIDGADLFHAKSGDLSGKVTKEDYYQAQQMRHREWGNRITHALKPFERMTLEEREGAGKQITKLVQNPGQIAAKRGTPIGDAAAEISKVLKEVHTYLREAGVDVGEVKDGYFPRVEDVMAIMKDPEGFKRQATKAYQANGMNLKDAKAAAEATFNRVMTGDVGAEHPNNSVSVFTQSRTWTKEADEIMRSYLIQHPADVLDAYLRRATKKAELARRLGKRDPGAKVPKGEDPAKWRDDPQGKLKDMIARLHEEGNGHLEPQFVDMIRSITGDFATINGAHGQAQRVAQMGRTYVALSHMSKATLTAMSEPGVAAIQSGNSIDMLRAYGETVRQWVPQLRKIGDGEYLRGFAEDAGFIGDGIDGSTMIDRMTGGGNTSAFLQKTTNNYFRFTGLTQITEATRVAAMKIGMVFLRRLAKDINEKTPYANIARKLLADAGIGPETMGGKSHEEFASWLSGLDKKASVADVRAQGDFGKAYESALGRFVNRSVQHPNGALKPYLAQKHPLGSLVYGLQSFNQSYTKNVLQRVARMSWEGIKNKDLTLQERLYCQMGMANLALLTGVTYAMSEARDALFPDPAREGDDPMSWQKKAGRAVSRAGLTGMLDPIFNFATGAKWTGTIVDALAGPALGDVARAGGDVKDVGQRLYNEATDEDYEPPDNNTLERRLATDAYNLAVQPALLGAMGAFAPTIGVTGKVVGVVGNYGLSHPWTREQAVKAAAGEKDD